MEDVHKPHLPHTPTKTPTIAQKVGPNNQKLSPQQRVSQHSKSVDQKFEEIHVSLGTLDMSTKNLVEKLGEINVSNMIMPENIILKVSEMLCNHRCKITEALSTIESKLKHFATGIDALQTKANIADTHVKELKVNQVEQESTVTKMINKLMERVESLENGMSVLHNSVHHTVEKKVTVKNVCSQTEVSTEPRVMSENEQESKKDSQWTEVRGKKKHTVAHESADYTDKNTTRKSRLRNSHFVRYT
jgi:ribosomal protein L17